jgi:hypothetical protein
MIALPPRRDRRTVMGVRILALLVALAAPAATAPPAVPHRDPLETRRAEIARDLVRLGTVLRREIAAGDAEAIGARVPLDGLRCGGSVVPRARVLRDLRAPRSWLHGVLFGGPGYVPRSGGAASLREFFQRAGEVSVAVSFEADQAAGPVGRPCLEFQALPLTAPPFPLCFASRGGSWVFTESLYPCG